MKRIISLMLVMVFTLGITVNAGVQKVDIGDYVVFGSYQNAPLMWQVIDIDHQGISTLFGEQVVDYMAFDAAEGGVSGAGSEISESTAYGSNDFATSNVKDWLNSDAYSVTYSTFAPKITSVRYFEDFAGDIETGVLFNEPGFLSGFQTNEKAALEEVTYQLGTSYVKGQYPKEEGALVAIGYPEKVISKHLSSQTSNVFLLSINELMDQVINNGFEAGKKLSSGEGAYYWLRTPDEQSGTLVATVDLSGNIYKTTANFAKTGVVPAVKLNLYDYPIVSGVGSKTNPYKLDLTYAGFTIDQVPEALRTEVSDILKGYASKWQQGLGFMSRELDVRQIETTIRGLADSIYNKMVYDVVAEDLGISLHRQLFLDNQLLTTNVVKGPDFNDLSALSEASKASISTLSGMGIINGYEDGSFRPNRSVSRAEVAKMITLIMGVEEKTLAKSFKDVAYGDWFHGYVENAREQRLIKGYGDGTYLPSKTVTLDELSIMISRVLRYHYGFKGAKDTTAISQLATGSYVATWAAEDVALLIESEVLSLEEPYSGNRAATRLEVVTNLDRLKDLIYD